MIRSVQVSKKATPISINSWSKTQSPLSASNPLTRFHLHLISVERCKNLVFWLPYCSHWTLDFWYHKSSSWSKTSSHHFFSLLSSFRRPGLTWWASFFCTPSNLLLKRSLCCLMSPKTSLFHTLARSVNCSIALCNDKLLFKFNLLKSLNLRSESQVASLKPKRSSLSGLVSDNSVWRISFRALPSSFICVANFTPYSVFAFGFSMLPGLK